MKPAVGDNLMEITLSQRERLDLVAEVLVFLSKVLNFCFTVNVAS